MKTSRSASVAFFALFVAAVAAVPAFADDRAPVGYQPAYYPSLWHGTYGGLHAGFGWSGDADGAIGGAQFGYNWQSQQLVYGIEGDISLSDIGIRERLISPFGVVTASGSIDWMATMRGRLGVLVQPRLLFYATAGLGVVSAEAKGSVTTVGFPTFHVSQHETDSVFVYGVGVESKWTETTSVRVEYLGFGETSLADGFGVIRLGVNFKFAP
jgi:outer membrane immunogenic protein